MSRKRRRQTPRPKTPTTNHKDQPQPMQGLPRPDHRMTPPKNQRLRWHPAWVRGAEDLNLIRKTSNFHLSRAFRVCITRRNDIHRWDHIAEIGSWRRDDFRRWDRVTETDSWRRNDFRRWDRVTETDSWRRNDFRRWDHVKEVSSLIDHQMMQG